MSVCPHVFEWLLVRPLAYPCACGTGIPTVRSLALRCSFVVFPCPWLLSLRVEKESPAVAPLSLWEAGGAREAGRGLQISS